MKHVQQLVKNKMKGTVIIIVLLCVLGWCYGQAEMECITNYFELENALLRNPANRYQIIEGYLPFKLEINPVCVTSYYYIGMNTTD